MAAHAAQDEYMVEGEESTAFTSYINVPYPAESELPRINASDKQKILGLQTEGTEDACRDRFLWQVLL